MPHNREVSQDWHMHRVFQSNERRPLLPYTQQHITPIPSRPEPDSSPSAFVILLLWSFFGVVGYGCYRLFLLGKWTWDGLIRLRGLWTAS
jgi:hypothetical protein